MTLERFELTCISQMLSVASFSEEIEDDKVFARIEQKISYAKRPFYISIKILKLRQVAIWQERKKNIISRTLSR